MDITMARERRRLNQNQVTMGITITRDILMDTEDMVDTTMARETQRLNQNQATITITITRAILMAMAMVIMDELIRKFQQFRQSVEFSRNESKYFLFSRK